MGNIFKIKNFYIIIFAISLSSLLIALYIEFFLGFKPCKLCTYQRIPYLIAIDIKADAELAFGKISATPTNFLIDSNGKIIKKYVGAMDFNKLRSKIKKLLST